MSNVEIAEDEASANMAIISNEVCVHVYLTIQGVQKCVVTGMRELTSSLEEEFAVLV